MVPTACQSDRSRSHRSHLPITLRQPLEGYMKKPRKTLDHTDHTSITLGAFRLHLVRFDSHSWGQCDRCDRCDRGMKRCGHREQRGEINHTIPGWYVEKY